MKVSLIYYAKFNFYHQNGLDQTDWKILWSLTPSGMNQLGYSNFLHIVITKQKNNQSYPANIFVQVQQWKL